MDVKVQPPLHSIGRETRMWTRLTESLQRIWLALHRGSEEQREERARARFWAEVREGQREADSESLP